jgi:iron-sulfur cluster repair protein YtfE (RIC family)
MSFPTQPFRDEHAELLVHIDQIRQVARELGRVSPEERRTMVTRVLGFLRGTLLPHAEAEEAVLYPEWARLVGAPDASAPMIHDHQAIASYTNELGHADVEDLERVRELLYGLHALISVHFRKEEDLQLPLLDAHPEVAEEILKRMSAHAHHAH